MARKKRQGITVTRQHNDMDCGTAALGMLLGVPYGDISATTRALYGTTKPNKRGLLLYHLEEIASAFDVTLRRIYKGRDYLNGQTGILGLLGGLMDVDGHWVVLKDGKTVIDPDDGTVWSLDDYLKRHRCRTATILVTEQL